MGAAPCGCAPPDSPPRYLPNVCPPPPRIERYSGECLHIDFGDCFEVAIQREKFPEKVPFRLTRMMVNAMGVSGVEGNFRCACEATMGVLRQQKDSVMAMLEAFMHDPLLNWGLTADEDDKERESSTSVAVNEFKTDEVKARADRNAGSLIEVRRAAVHVEQSQQDEKLLNARAIKVLRRIRSKLIGTDFPQEERGTLFPQSITSGRDDALPEVGIVRQGSVRGLMTDGESPVGNFQLHSAISARSPSRGAQTGAQPLKLGCDARGLVSKGLQPSGL